MSAILYWVFRLMCRNIILHTVNDTLSTPDVLSCATQCTPPCVAFFYHEEAQRCYLSSHTYHFSDPRLKSETGWVFFQCTQVSVPCYHGYRNLPSAGMCVKFVTDKKTYDDARADCEAVPGGRVVHVNTAAKITAVEAVHRAEYANELIFIGLNDQPVYRNGDFHWTDGTNVTDNNWDDGQPDNRERDNCVAIDYSRNYTWVDLYCTDVLMYICEVVS